MAVLLVRFWFSLVSLAASCDLADVTSAASAQCSTYCDDNPGVCERLCDENPSMAGCPWNGGSVPPEAPPACESCEALCTGNEASTVECLACKACIRPPKFCALNPGAKGCDNYCCNKGCSEFCYRKEIGEIVVPRQCMWHVKDQFHEVFAPIIMEANIELTCPLAEWFEMNLESCELCSRLHAPCNDTYVACGGCCGTPLHTQYNAIRNLSVNTHHSCDEIKHYFLNRNSIDVACQADPPSTGPIGQVNITRVDPNDPTMLDSGIITEECRTKVDQVMCEQVPFKLKFTCNDCGNKGSPPLLDSCCDKCVEWINSLDSNPGIPSHVRPYAWCEGCNATEVTPLNPLLPAFPWDGAERYANYTEARADQGILDYIDENVCRLLSPSCGEETETTTTKPGFLEPTVDVKPCMPWDQGKCGGRRMAGVDFEDGSDIPEGSCDAAEYMKATYASVPGADDSGRDAQPESTTRIDPLEAELTPTQSSSLPPPGECTGNDPPPHCDTDNARGTFAAAVPLGALCLFWFQ